MRWLLLPQVGMGDPRVDSNFLLFTDMARTFAEAGDWVTLTGPWPALPFSLPPGVLYVPTPGNFDYYANMFAVDLEWLMRTFSRRWGTDLIDAVVTSKIPFIPYLQATMSDSARCDDLPVYAFEPAVPGAQGTVLRGEVLLRLRAFAYVSGVPIFLTQHEVDRAMRLAQRFLTPHEVDQISREHLLLPPGLDFTELDALNARQARPSALDQFTLFAGLRLNASKRAADIGALYDALWQAGVPAECVVCSPTTERVAARWPIFATLAQRPHVRVRYQCARPAYLEEASRAHAYVVWSPMEGAPVGFIEQLYLGVVGCFLRTEWSERFLPEDYPWFFERPAEAAALILTVARDYPSCAERIERWRPWMRERFTRASTWGVVRRDAERRLRESMQARMSSGVVGLIDRVWELLPDTFSLTTLLHLIGRVSRSFKPSLQQKRWWREPTNFDIAYYLTDRCGCVDTCTTRIPQYRKPTLIPKEDP